MKILIMLMLTSATCFGAFTNIVGGVDTLGTWMNKINSGFSVVESNIDAVELYTIDDSRITVARGSTAILSWVALTNAYESACALTPGGNALSETNRAVVIIPPGIYDAGTNTLVLDADYVDIRAMLPEVVMDHHRDYSLSHDNLVYFGWTNGYSFLFPGTRIKGSPAVGSAIMIQTVEDIRLSGFSIECNYDGTSTNGAQIGFYCTTPEGGENSLYEKMTFYSDTDFRTIPMQHKYCFDGEWIDCVGSDFSFRLQNDNDGAEDSQEFRASMINCHAGIRSFGGDATNGIIVGAYFESCSAPGGAFGGCTYEAIGNDSDTMFIDCTALPLGRSFGLGDVCAGTLIRCRGGELCAGATTVDSQPGTFTGHAIDCQFGAGSLGGRGTTEVGTPTTTNSYCSGIIDECTVEDSVLSANLLGAKIRNSYFLQGSSYYVTYSYAEIVGGVTNQVLTWPTLTPVSPPWYYIGATTNLAVTDMFNLLDGNSIILDSIIEVNSAGTGTAVNATSPQNIVFLGNTFNNSDVEPSGLSSNVTGISGSGNWSENAILKDGSVAMTGDLNLGGKDLDNISANSASLTAGSGSNLKVSNNLELGTGYLSATGAGLTIADPVQVQGLLESTGGMTLLSGGTLTLGGYMTDPTQVNYIGLDATEMTLVNGNLNAGTNDITAVNQIVFADGTSIAGGGMDITNTFYTTDSTGASVVTNVQTVIDGVIISWTTNGVSL